jgi:hypothetical protein
VEFPSAQIEQLDDLVVSLVSLCAADFLSLYRVGPDTDAMPPVRGSPAIPRNLVVRNRIGDGEVSRT